MIIIADVIEGLKQLSDESVHCVVTSPPYWGLRDYGVEGQIGLEQTPQEYVDRMVGVFREVRRVLRADGTLWLNVGDSYASGEVGRHDSLDTKKWEGKSRQHVRMDTGVKRGNLVGIPWRLAFALQDDGWYLRSDIIWAKPNPMPESVKSRPTKSHEYVFLLAKGEDYFYDHEAVKEEASGRASGNKRQKGAGMGDKHFQTREGLLAIADEPCFARNLRDVWFIATQPFKGAHFATFPQKLVEPCIKAGTSEGGCCAACEDPLERIVEKGDPDLEHQKACGGGADGSYSGEATKDYEASNAQDPSATKARILAGMRVRRTVGWKPTCSCDSQAPTVPATVLDPFCGSGTTGVVARNLGRDFIGIELNPEYAKMVEARLDTRPPAG